MVKNRIFHFLITCTFFSSFLVLTADESQIQNENTPKIEETAQEAPSVEAEEKQKGEGQRPSPEELREFLKAQKKQKDTIAFLTISLENALTQCQAFETFLDKTIPLIRTKSPKNFPPELWLSLCDQLLEMRKILLQARQVLTQEAVHPFMMLNGLSVQLFLCLELASYMEKIIIDTPTTQKPFDMMRVFARGQKMQKENMLQVRQNTKLLSQKIVVLEELLAIRGVSFVSRVARSIESNVFHPLARIGGGTVLKYSAILGGLALYAFWKHGGTSMHEKIIEYLLEPKDNGNTRSGLRAGDFSVHEIHRKGYDPLHDNIKIAEEKFINFNYNGRTDFNSEFKGTFGFKDKLWLSFCRLVGLPSNFAPSEEGRTLDFAYIRSDLVKSYPQLIPSIDGALTGVMTGAGGQLALLTTGGSMVLPGVWEKINENVIPTIKGKIQTGWNSLLGGVHEKSLVTGYLEIGGNHTLDAVIGMDYEKKNIFEPLIEYLINPEKTLREHGDKLHLSLGYLFTGNTRVGKTYSIEGFVGSLKKKLAELGLPQDTVKTFDLKVNFIQQYTIPVVVQWLRSQAPAVVFIDETDLLGLQRGIGGGLLADFLTELHKLLYADLTKPIVLFCATNRSDNIDFALRTPGRFGKEIPFEYPHSQHRRIFIEKELVASGFDPKQFDIEQLISETAGKSYEIIRRGLKKAIWISWQRGTVLTQDLIIEGFNIELREIIMENRKQLSDSERQILAAHFAGRASLPLLLNTKDYLACVTIKARALPTEEKSAVAEALGNSEKRRPDEEEKKIVSGGLFFCPSGDSEGLKTRQMILNDIMALLAGFVAEEILLGDCGYSCESELYQKAYEMAEKLISGKLDTEKMPETLRNKYANKVLALLDECKEKVRKLLQQNKAVLEKIADELRTRELLSGAEVQTIINEFNKTSDKSTMQA